MRKLACQQYQFSSHQPTIVVGQTINVIVARLLKHFRQMSHVRDDNQRTKRETDPIGLLDREVDRWNRARSETKQTIDTVYNSPRLWKSIGTMVVSRNKTIKQREEGKQEEKRAIVVATDCPARLTNGFQGIFPRCRLAPSSCIRR